MLLKMSSSERERERRIAAEVEPLILEALSQGRELREVAEEVAHRYELDEVKAYRWTSYIDESRQKRRKRIALVALGVTWLGAIATVAGVVALLFVATTAAWILVTGLGLLFAIPGLIVALFARKIAYRRSSGSTTFK